MRGYYLTDLTEVTGGRLIQRSDQVSQPPVEHLLTDSRKIIDPSTSLFFAIRGERNNGHLYVKDAYDAGVRNFVVESSRDLHIPSDASILQVANALKALQSIAAWHRHKFSLPVVGITGSNGKTIVKEWINQLLRQDLTLVRSPKSYNSQIGVPLSVWNISSDHQLALFEAGISKPGEMAELQPVIDPNIGIFTCLGPAHDDGFATPEEKLHEKLLLFAQSDLLVHATDQLIVEDGIRNFCAAHPKLKTLSWSRKNNPADLRFETETVEGITHIRLRKGSQIIAVSIPFTDEASIDNACICFAFLIGINRISTDILNRFRELQPIEMRLQLKEAINHCMLINDSYSADLNAFQIALDFMQQQSAGLEKCAIVSDILQSGMSEKELYAEMARLLRQKEVGKVIGIGPGMMKYRKLFAGAVDCYPSTEHFLIRFRSSDFNRQIILLKGARSFAFEKISALLERQVHETVFEINLNALVHNFNSYRNLLKPGVKIMGMVKAFSYGAGSYEIAKVLEFHRADYLTVAYADEGVTLRQSGIKLPIMVMNPEVNSIDAIIRYNLEPELYSLPMLNRFIASANGEEVSVHIEVDTGMKRLGFDEEDLPALIAQLDLHPNIRIKSVFAHLAASDEKKHDDFTHEQISRFRRMSDKLIAACGYPVLRHILNSGGIVRFPEAQFDMVRLGIGLYGIDPSGKLQRDLQQIGTLRTVISQIRTIKAHETVGYSRRGTVLHESRIATAAIGYADGLNRRLGNGKGYMVVNGQRAPIVGSICMDMTMIDVTHINCREGDEVIVFGKDPDISSIAEKTGTIPYEVLTSISQRVRRVYFYE